jgi:hypothetical protein
MVVLETIFEKVRYVRDKLGDNPHVLQASLCVGDSHSTVQPVDETETTRVIESWAPLRDQYEGDI